MKTWPEFNENGDLPPGVHKATLPEVIDAFGKGTFQRRRVAQRLERIHSLAVETGQVAHFIIFGSFVTNKPTPQDVDIFLLMEDAFDAQNVQGETRILFDHMAAQNYEGASIFWVRRLAAVDGERAAIEYWQLKRDGTKRGIVEVLTHDS